MKHLSSLKKYSYTLIALFFSVFFMLNADVNVIIEPVKPIAAAGETNLFYVTLTRDASDSPTSVTAEITLPTGISYVSDDGGTTGSTSESGGVITWIASGNPDEEEELVINTTINSGFNGQLLTTTAEITAISPGSVGGLGNTDTAPVNVLIKFIDWDVVTINGGSSVTVNNSSYTENLSTQGVEATFIVEDFGNNSTGAQNETVTDVGELIKINMPNKNTFDNIGPNNTVNSLQPTHSSRTDIVFNAGTYPNGIRGIGFSIYDVDETSLGSGFRDGVLVYGTDVYGNPIFPTETRVASNSHLIQISTEPAAFYTKVEGDSSIDDENPKGRVTFLFGSQDITSMTLIYWNQPPADGSAQGVLISPIYRIAPLDPSIKITANRPFLNECQDFTYQVTVTNNSPDEISNLTVDIDLPTEVTYVSDDSGGDYSVGLSEWFIDSIPGLESVTLNITVNVNTGTVVGQMITGQATINDPYNQFPYGQLTDLITKTVVGTIKPFVCPYDNPLCDDSLDVFVTKSVDNSSPIEGDTITFTVNVSNTGPNAIANIVIEDLLPTGLTFVSSMVSSGTYNSNTGIWEIPGVANNPYTIETLTIVATVDADTGGQLITNTATFIDSYNQDPNNSNDSASVTLSIRRTDLLITKTASTTTPQIGDTVIFTLTATNNGPNNATAVTVTDNLPTGLTFIQSSGDGTYNSSTGIWDIGELTSGSTVTRTITVNINSNQTGQTITNTASITDPYRVDPYSNNNSATVMLFVQPFTCQNIVDSSNALTKTTNIYGSDPFDFQHGSDLKVTAWHQVGNTTYLVVGGDNDSNTYMRAYTFNNTTKALTTLSGGTEGFDAQHENNVNTFSWLTYNGTTYLAVGADESSNITTRLYQLNEAGDELINIANAFDTQHGNDINTLQSITINNTVYLATGGREQSGISTRLYTFDPYGSSILTEVTNAFDVQHDATVRNLQWIVVEDTYYLGVGGDSDSGTRVRLYQFNEATTQLEEISNAFDMQPGNNVQSLSWMRSDNCYYLSIGDDDNNNTPRLYTFTPEIATPLVQQTTAFDILHDAKVFSVHWVNIGNRDYLVIGGDLDSGVTLRLYLFDKDSTTLTSQTINTGDQHGDCVNSVDTINIDGITYLAIAGLTDGGDNDIVSRLYSFDTLLDPYCDDSRDLTISKTVDDDTPVSNQQVTFTITVTNNGPNGAVNIVVQDILPSSLTFVSATPSAGSYNVSTGLWTIPTIAPNSSKTLELKARVSDVSTGTITNTATLLDPYGLDSYGGNNSASVILTTTFCAFGTPTLVQQSVVPTDTLSFSASAVAWQTIGDKELLAVLGSFTGIGGDESLRLYRYEVDEYGTKRLVEESKVSTSILAIDSTLVALDWCQINGEYYLAVGGRFVNNGTSGDEDLRLYKLETDSYSNCVLTEIDKVPTTVLSLEVYTLKWIDTGSEKLLAVGGAFIDSGSGSGDEDLRLYTVTPDEYGVQRLVEIYKVPTTTLSGVTHTTQWKNDNGSILLAVGGIFSGLGGDEDLRLYALEPGPYGLPILTEIYKVPSTTLPSDITSLDWKDINGECYLAVGASISGPNPGGTELLRLYQLQPGPYTTPILNEVYKVPTSILDLGGIVTVEWKQVGNDCFLAIGGKVVGGSGEDLQLYKFATNNYGSPELALVSKISRGIISGDVLTARWNTIDGCCLLAVGGRFDEIYGSGDEDLRLFALECITQDNFDLIITKDVDNATPTETNTITYTINVTNNGPGDADSPQVNDLLPAGLTFVSSNPSQGSYNSTTGMWDISFLPASAMATLEIKATVDVGTAETTITNTATIAETYGLDPYTNNNSASVDITVRREFDLTIEKTVSNSMPTVGSSVTYTITVTNIGPSTAQNVQVNDQLPTGVTFSSATESKGTYNPASGVWFLSSMDAGDTETLTITVVVNVGTQDQTIVNTATVDDIYFPDPYANNNSASVSIMPIQNFVQAGSKLLWKVVTDDSSACTINVT